jgi:spore coat polysaccharide biosynthesis protein SpsF
MKTIIVIQARTGSSRLPGKVLLPLAGKPLLVRMVERVMAAKTADNVVVATTQDKGDDVIEELCKEHSIDCFRGHPTDLLDRHFKAAQQFNADVVVKIPSDCPLIDPSVIDKVLSVYLDQHIQYDYVSNLHPASYPDGNDVEAMHTDTLEVAWHEAKKDYEREHTTPFIWEHPKRFRIGNVAWETGLNYSMTHRFTIDYQEDYDFIKRVYDELWTAERPIFSLEEILALLEEKPEILAINAQYAGVNWYRHHLNDLQTVTPDETKLIF